jgi:riboflavin synthase alpha subunit
VDGVGRVRSLETEGDGARLTLDVPQGSCYCAGKGSLAVDGVSLTIAA